MTDKQDGHASQAAQEADAVDDGGVLRIEFDASEERLDDADRDEFLKVFDDRGLAFVYQEKTSDGQTSRFNKLVNRDAS